MILIDEKYIKETIFRRERTSHKGDFGKILIFAGSAGMAGAAILNGRAALKSGAGLVQYLLPDFNTPLLPILQTGVPEATCVKMSPQLKISGYSAISAGSGLGQTLEALTILTDIIETYTGILLLDADALNLIAGNDLLADTVRSSGAQIIITPHIGEAKRLLHTPAAISTDTERESAARKLAEMYNCTVVLKGAGTLVASKENSFTDIYKNTTGNPGMATAGSGDCLAGIITSLAGQGYAPSDAARIGVFIHGNAGDLAAEEFGEMGMTASDIVDFIPYALKKHYQHITVTVNPAGPAI